MQPGQLTQTAQRDIPCHRTSCSTIKAGGKDKEGADAWRDGICLPKKPRHDASPAVLKQWINSLLCFTCARSSGFTHSAHAMSSHALTSSRLPCPSTGSGEQLSGAEIAEH